VTLSTYIYDRRTALRLSQRDLARRANVSQATVGALERGTESEPMTRTLDGLAIGLECDVMHLIGLARADAKQRRDERNERKMLTNRAAVAVRGQVPK